MKWRFIPFRHYNPYLKTALNEISIESVINTKVPIFWLSGWENNCVNLGVSQKVNEVLNLYEVKKNDISIVRRQGGGGTTFLSKSGEITWNIASSKEFFPGDINEIYKFICNKIVEVLKDLGINSSHKIINDVITEKGKISGATLKKVGDVIYIAGTLLYDVDKELMNKILRPENDSNKISISEKDKKITCIRNENDVSFEEVLNSLERVVLQDYEYEVSDWTSEELEKAEILKEKYSSEEWVYGERQND